MIYAVFLFVFCGIGAAVVASNKGRNVFGWFLLGLFLGPIGFILSLVISKDTTNLETAAISSGTMRKCPFCAELVKAEAALCKHCGKELPAIERPPLQVEKLESLPEAALNGNWSTAKRLLEAGANPDEVNDNGNTALDLARMRGDKLMIKLLISYGANDKQA